MPCLLLLCTAPALAVTVFGVLSERAAPDVAEAVRALGPACAA